MKVANYSNNIIYADNAATTKPDEEALALMFDLQQKFFANPSSAYKLARPLKKILQESREEIASCINAQPQEIFFTSGGTESNNWAIKSVMLSKEKLLSTNNNSYDLITMASEHQSVLRSCENLRQLGFSIKKLSGDKNGILSGDELQQALSDNTKLVSVMTANNETGTIQPIKELAEVAHAHGIIFHTDAVQAVGHIPINVKELGVDMLSASAHKFNGLKGIGFLYVREGLNLESYMDGGEQEFGKRGGTENVPNIAAMSFVIKKNCQTMSDDATKVKTCVDTLLECLRGLDYKINGSDNRLPGLLSLSFKNCDGEVLMHRLDLKNICISTGAACNSNQQKISHVLQSLQIPNDYIHGTIRISFGKENTRDEAEIIGNALKALISDIQHPRH